MKTLQVFYLAMATVLASCSSDDDNEQFPANPNIAFYTMSSTATVTLPQPNVYQGYMRGNIVNNKFFSESFFNPATFEESTIQLFHYTGDLLTSYETGYTWESYYYDNQQRLAATTFGDDTMQTLYRRFIYQSDTQVFAEILTQPYDAPDTQILERYVLTLDGNSNIIAAGPDNDLDGTIDQVNHFTYANGNLISAELYNGSAQTHSYSGVVNNFSVLSDNTYGKQNARLMQAQLYGGASFYPKPEHNRNIETQEFESGQYEVLPNGYYRKSFRSYQYEGGHTDATCEFFFQ